MERIFYVSTPGNVPETKIHQRSLRISYKNQKTSYQNLLGTHEELTIHQRYLQILMTEIYKIANGVTSPIVKTLSLSFEVKNIILEIFKYSQLTSENTK